MANASSDNWAARVRRSWAERHAAKHGTIRRAELMQTFGLSPAQASADLQALQEEHRGCLVYDLRGKTYRWRQGRTPRLPIPPPILSFDL